MSEWRKRAVCKCGWHSSLPFGDVFHLHVECCPDCGVDKHRMVVRTMRLTTDYSGVVWWNPISWFGKCRWENLEDKERSHASST